MHILQNWVWWKMKNLFPILWLGLFFGLFFVVLETFKYDNRRSENFDKHMGTGEITAGSTIYYYVSSVTVDYLPNYKVRFEKLAFIIHQSTSYISNPPEYAGDLPYEKLKISKKNYDEMRELINEK